MDSEAYVFVLAFCLGLTSQCEAENVHTTPSPAIKEYVGNRLPDDKFKLLCALPPEAPLLCQESSQKDIDYCTDRLAPHLKYKFCSCHVVHPSINRAPNLKYIPCACTNDMDATLESNTWTYITKTPLDATYLDTSQQCPQNGFKVLVSKKGA